MPTHALTVNGRRRSVDADSDTPLLWVLRDSLGLTGTKFGCGEGTCGACTIHDSGRAVRSCTVTIAEAAGRTYTTIEGLGASALHACQQAWLDLDVAQCGFCQPGMIMTAAALLAEKPEPRAVDVDEALAGSICRCGTYTRIREAILSAARTSKRP